MDDTTLDLQEGDEERADAIAAKHEKVTPKKTVRKIGQRKTTTPRAGRPPAIEQEIRSRLDRTLDRISEALRARQDFELADVVYEDKEAMTQGIVSLTRTVKWLRNPLLMALNLVEPVLAFGRVARILFRRAAERRARRIEEQQAYAESEVVDGTPVGPEVYSAWTAEQAG